MGSQNKIVIGQIGVGGFGGHRRLQIRETGLFRLAACHDRNEDVLRKACAEEGSEAVGTWQELIDRADLEAIVVSTGIDTHAELAVAAMRAGKHVFIEKPLCSSTEEVDALLSAQEETGLVVGMGHKSMAGDYLLELIRKLQDEDKLGTLVCYEENSSHSGGLEIKPGDWRGIKWRNPGGMLMQCGVHSLHHLTHQFGLVESVAAMMRFDANPDTETADAANVLIRHESGMIGTLSCYHVTAYIHEFRLFGTKGTLYVDTYSRRAWYQARKRNDREERVELEITSEPAGSSCANLVTWARAIRGEGEPSPSLQDGINAVLPVFAAEISDRENRPVTMSELTLKVVPI